jgi:phosphatidate cytidylyltransferase
VLVPLAVCLVWWSLWSVVAFAAAVAALAVAELYGAFAHGGHQPQAPVGVVLALAPVLAAALQTLTALHVMPPIVTLAIVISLVAALPRHQQEGALAAWALTLAGALYIGGLLSYLVLLRAIETPLRPGPLVDLGLAPGAAWVFLVLFVTYWQDALAYFVGKYLGRTHMTSLSPKKTWEGAAGGMAGAVGGSLLAVWLFGLPIDLLAGALLGLVGGIVGPLGDLAESFIKRQVGLKDVGRLIPGHGGMLDRIDSLLFTAPVLFYAILALAS